MTTIQDLHKKALHCVRVIQKSEYELLETLQEIDQRKGFLALGYPSLFVYAVQGLKLSEASAYNYITVSRKAKEVPQLKTEIKMGTLSVSKARKIVPVLNKSNSTLWIEKAKTLPRLELEKEVAKVAPKSITPEKVKYITESRLNLSIGISEEIHQKLKRVQDLLSQKKKKPVLIEEALNNLINEYIERHDPIEKAKRNLTQRDLKPVPGQADRGFDNPERTAIPSQIKHQIHVRDRGQCTFRNHRGERCTNRRWIDLHHVQPIAKGGGHSEQNIVSLCQSHHQWTHRSDANNKLSKNLAAL